MQEQTVYKSAQAANHAHTLYRELLSSWPVAYEEKILPTRLGNTFALEAGPPDAPLVLMLHGTMATAAMWRAEMAALAERYHVVALDVIGDAGFSAPVRPPTSSDQHARWLQDVLSALGQRRAHLVGLSFGGWLALDFATRFPEQVASLTLITPGGVADKNILVWALPLLLLGPWGAKKVSERILGPAPTQMTEPQAKLSALSTAIFAGMRPRTDSLRAISDAELSALTMPTLVLLGADDVTMDSAKIAQRFKRLAPQAETQILAGKRHFLGEQSVALRQFLERAARKVV